MPDETITKEMQDAMRRYDAAREHTQNDHARLDRLVGTNP
jgi:hypothetical protein